MAAERLFPPFDDALGDPSCLVEAMFLDDAPAVRIRQSLLADLLRAVIGMHPTPCVWSLAWGEVQAHLRSRGLVADHDEFMVILDDLVQSGEIREDRSKRLYVAVSESAEHPEQILDQLETVTTGDRKVSARNSLSISSGSSPSKLRSTDEDGISCHGDRQRRNLLVRSNLGLVHFVIRRFPSWVENSALTYDDEFQAGCLGLIRAAEKFDWSFGTQFSTYAVPWIRQSITRSHRNLGRMIRLPVHIEQRISSLASIRQTYSSDDEFLISLDEISRDLSTPVEEALDALRVEARFTAIHSLDELNVGDLDPLWSSEEPFYELEKSEPHVLSLLSEIPRREALCLCLCFGILVKRRFTLQEIGVWLGCSRERVRQIRDVALKRLKEHPGSQSLHEMTH